MKHYFRVSLAESLFDGESWSVNQWYEQPYILYMDTDTVCTNDIVKALKKGGLLNKYIKNNPFNLEGDADYGLYLERYYSKNIEPLVLMLQPIDHNDIERELSASYGIKRKQTILCNI